jgi:peptidoglycan/LPS O-acetylase OafA/YrhL
MTAPTPQRAARLPAIDILRGVAIIWVIAFHLSADIGGVEPLDSYYERIRDEALDLAFIELLRGLWDLVLRLGYQGVPLFMMASGFAITLSRAARAEPEATGTFWIRRFRALLVPYWIAFGLTVSTIAALAAVRYADAGTSWWHEFRETTVAGEAPYYLDVDILIAGATVIPRAFAFEYVFAPSPSLWFVPLFIQFYLLFPLLAWALERGGPWLFAAAALLLTLLARTALMLVEDEHGLLIHWWVDATWLPFNLFTFALGMALAWVYIHRRDLLERYTGGALDGALVVYAGLVIHTLGSLAQGRAGLAGVVATPAIVLGLTLIALPFIVRAPAEQPRQRWLALVVAAGAMSYSLLIASDPFRFVIGTMHTLDAAVWAWTLFWLAYAPMLVGLALLVERASRALIRGRRSVEKGAVATAHETAEERRLEPPLLAE